MLPWLSARPAPRGRSRSATCISGVGADPRHHRQAHARSSSIAKFAMPDDRGVAHIDDLQDAIAGHRSARARIGPRVGAFRKPADPALTSLPRPAGSAHCKPPLSIVKIGSGYRAGSTPSGSGPVSKICCPYGGPRVRIHLPPAKSPRLAQARPLQVETIFPLFRDDIFRPR